MDGVDVDVTPAHPPVRAFDAALAQRVAQGLGGIWEARQIEGLVAWMDVYERALKRIAVYGDAASAMLAARVMIGDAEALDEQP